ncbi:MAG: response regulator [Chryseolinea sp.]
MMNKSIRCKHIMLIDDNHDDNFFHEREIRKTHLIETVIVMNSGTDAMAYLKSHTQPYPDLIFLDINMPGMNGWEFLDEYNKLDKQFHCKAIVVMLTTSENPFYQSVSKGIASDFKTKPLTKAMLEEVIKTYFPESVVDCN